MAQQSSAQILVEERAFPPLVQLSVQLPTGALQDPEDQGGRASLCWDAAARAAGGRDRKAFASAIDSLGARLSVDVGQTSTRLVISGLVEHADAMAALLADVVFRPGFAVADVDEARALRLAALEDREDDDAALAADGVVRYALRGSPLGRPVDGTASSVSGLDVAACKSAHRKAISDVGAWLGVAGALPTSDAQALCRKHFAPLLLRPPQRAKMPTAPAGDGRRLLLIDHPGQPSAQVALALRAPGARDPLGTALVVADSIVGGAFTSRLSQQVRELRGWTYSIQSQWLAGPDDGLWLLSWAPRNAVTARSIDLVLRQLELAAADGPTAAEVAFAREHLRGSQRLALETAYARLGARLGALLLGLPADWVQGFEARLERVDKRATAAAMGQTFAARDVAVVVVGDAEKLRPTLDKLASGFEIEVLREGQTPEATALPGRKSGKTLARPQPPNPPPDDTEDHGPEFDEGGEQLEPPATETPTADDEAIDVDEGAGPDDDGADTGDSDSGSEGAGASDDDADGGGGRASATPDRGAGRRGESATPPEPPAAAAPATSAPAARDRPVAGKPPVAGNAKSAPRAAAAGKATTATPAPPTTKASAAGRPVIEKAKGGPSTDPSSKHR